MCCKCDNHAALPTPHTYHQELLKKPKKGWAPVVELEDEDDEF